MLFQNTAEIVKGKKIPENDFFHGVERVVSKVNDRRKSFVSFVLWDGGLF